MIVEHFLDTNILLYAVSRNPSHLSKKTKAIELIEGEPFGISAQVLQEFYTNATAKADFRMTPETALEFIENLVESPCIDIDSDLVKIAIEISARYRISYWDGAILAAAQALGTPVLYSEDLNHGQLYGTVRVLNPFRETLALPPGFHDTAQLPLSKD